MDEPLILDRYRPLAELGSGGSGSVVLAFDTKMARRVAIKRLALDRRRSGLSEARTAALLAHPNIVTVHEWEADSHAAYLVMEYVDGVTLAELLDTLGTPLDDDEAAAVVRAVSDELQYAHENGVLHLDVKPANVLVTREGRIKVADFGVAALTDRTRGAIGGAGTIGYMPPEQIRSETVDDATDQWAFAALVYEVLTLANPFDADTREGSLFKIEVAPVPAPSDFSGDLAPGIDDVLLVALSPDPGDRYPSVRDMAVRLLDLLGDPRAGEESLAETVSAILEEEESSGETPVGGVGLWDRLVPYTLWFRRAGAVGAAGWLAWAGLTPFSLGQPALWGTVALVAVGAALAPGLGLGLGLLIFTAGLASAVGAGWAGAFAVLFGAHWLWRGRRGTGDAFLPAYAPVLGVVRAALATPFIAGFAFEPLPAAAAAGLAALTTMTASAVTGGAPPYLSVSWRFIAQPWADTTAVSGAEPLLGPGPLVAVTAWAVAGAVMSLACQGGSRGSAVLGTLLAAVTLGVGYALWIASGDGPSVPALLEQASAALMVVVVVVALGPPSRGETGEEL